MKPVLLLPLALLSATLAFAQNLPQLKEVEGGTRILGGGYQYAVKDYYMVLMGDDTAYAKINEGQTVIGEIPDGNNPDRQVTVASFFLAETEVSNVQYRDFLVDSLLTTLEKTQFRKDLKVALKGDAHAQFAVWHPVIEKAGKAGLLPDSSCWATDFRYSYNQPLVKNYFCHKAFDQYPVVGVSWNQAKAYCQWLTTEVNASRAAKGKEPLPAYRLPTEAEWEYAAMGRGTGNAKTLYGMYVPWTNENNRIDRRGEYTANIKTDHGNYIGDSYEYTCPVTGFKANSFGLYNMAGNVAEWCEDVFRFNATERPDVTRLNNRLFEGEESAPITRVVKGGSWADYRYAAIPGSRTHQLEDAGSSRVGFRVAMIKPAEME
jgi:formylglycine-generating enzyme